jgi:hypothetical protein
VILDIDGIPPRKIKIDPYTQLPEVLPDPPKALGFLDELYIVNQYQIDHKEFHKVCRTHELSEMLSVACGSDYVYLLEEHLFDQNKLSDDVYSIYAIDPKTGIRIGRADIALFTGNTYEKKMDSTKNYAMQYFPGELSGEYGIMHYAPGSLYAPHDYHQKGVLVEVGERTSCNALMPCSQFLPGPAAPAAKIVREELYMEILGIDSVGGHDLAISYITFGDGLPDKCGVIKNELGQKYYNIDIMHMSSNETEFAYDSLDLFAFGRDYSHSCVEKFQWEIDIPYSKAGKLVTYTNKYIAVPLLLRPIDFDKTPHVESVIALFDRETHAYHSYIKLGKDYHRDDTHEVVHPNQPVHCGEETEKPPLKMLDIKMDVVIIDIDSDCDQIAVTYSMRFNKEHMGGQIATYFPPPSDTYQIYTEVFRDEDHLMNCDAINVPVCDKPAGRGWKVGI